MSRLLFTNRLFFNIFEAENDMDIMIIVNGGAIGGNGSGPPPLLTFPKVCLEIRTKVEKKLVTQEGCARSNAFVM